MINQPQTIAHAKAGQLFPKEYLETALRKCPTVSGYAIRDVTDGRTTLETDNYDRAVTLENLMTVNEQSKDYDAILYLANYGGKYTKDDVQPFVLKMQNPDDPDGEGIPIVAYFVEGDFPKFSDSESGHTDEFNFADQIITPKLEEFFEDAEGDVGKFIAKLHKPSFEKDLMAHVGHRAKFTFLPLEGDAIAFGNNQLGMEYEWGEVSQTHGFGEKKDETPITQATAKVTAAVKKFDPFGKKTAVEKSALPDGVHQVPAKKEFMESSAHGNKVAVSPPPKLEKSARNYWLRLFNGKLPGNHLEKNVVIWVEPNVVPFAQRQLEYLQDVKNLEQEMRTGVKPKPVDMKQDAPTDDYPKSFLMDDKDMSELTTTLAGFLDRQKVPSALDIQKSEIKDALFSEKAGIPFTDTWSWFKEDAAKLSHKALVNLWAETRRYAIEHTDLKDLVATSIKDTHVEAKAILQPDDKAKKRNLLFGKKTG